MLVHAIKFVFVLAWLQLVNVVGKEDGFVLQCKSIAKCIYRTKAECDSKNGHRPKVVPFTCISQKSFKRNVYSRFFHVFVAKGIKIKCTLAIYLHGECEWSGGAGNYRLDKYASGQQETWKKNTSCKYWYDSRKENGYKDAHGNACKPDEKNTHAPTGFWLYTQPAWLTGVATHR